MDETPIEFGDVYLATDAQKDSRLDDVVELYLLVTRDPSTTMRVHQKVFLSELESDIEGIPTESYCVEVIEGKFVNLKGDPQGATPDIIRKKLQLISKLNQKQRAFFKEALEAIQRRHPGSLKYMEEC